MVRNFIPKEILTIRTLKDSYKCILLFAAKGCSVWLNEMDDDEKRKEYCKQHGMTKEEFDERKHAILVHLVEQQELFFNQETEADDDEDLSESDTNDNEAPIGYGNPPKEFRFKKGNKGRPKEKDVPYLERLNKELDKPIFVPTKNGKRVKTTKRKLALNSMANKLANNESTPRNNHQVFKDLDRYKHIQKALEEAEKKNDK